MRVHHNNGSSASTELRAAEAAVVDEADAAAAERQEICRTCRYWLSHGDPPDWKQQYGDCRRYPPAVVPGADADCTEVQWPATERGEWCGEWRSAAELPR